MNQFIIGRAQALMDNIDTFIEVSTAGSFFIFFLHMLRNTENMLISYCCSQTVSLTSYPTCNRGLIVCKDGETPPRPSYSCVKAAVTPDLRPDKPSRVVKQLCGGSGRAEGALTETPLRLTTSFGRSLECQYKTRNAICLPLVVAYGFGEKSVFQR